MNRMSRSSRDGRSCSEFKSQSGDLIKFTLKIRFSWLKAQTESDCFNKSCDLFYQLIISDAQSFALLYIEKVSYTE